MTKIVERMHGELTDLLNLIRRMGGGVVFEDFPGAFEEDAEAPAAGSVTQRGLIDEANKLAEALERLRGGGDGTCEEYGNPITPARLASHTGSHNLPPTSGPPGAGGMTTPGRLQPS
jgi:hypothetical protein